MSRCETTVALAICANTSARAESRVTGGTGFVAGEDAAAFLVCGDVAGGGGDFAGGVFDCCPGSGLANARAMASRSALPGDITTSQAVRMRDMAPADARQSSRRARMLARTT